MSVNVDLLSPSVVSCSVLVAPSNGTLTGDSVSYWSEVTYSCDLGYILSGDADRTCQADGVWSGSDPVCNSKHYARTAVWSCFQT